ncbi:MAG TPA: sterol desaturase family protein [Acidimicrobiia bacterium]|nr:sterol desaturase family protein [Acidimicrobiia bacterium]
MSLRDATALFFSRRNGRVVVAAVAVALVARLVHGGFGGLDLVVVAAVVAAQPFVEWTIHVSVLHFRPRSLGRRTVDLPIARKHRAHHRDPRDVDLVFVPLPDLLLLLVAIPAGFLLLEPDLGLALTGVLTGYALLAVYEWTHFLIHQPYTPKTRLYRYVRRAHVLHHFRNENYWFGVTMHLGDHVLRTFPAKDDVPLSPTARTLGVEETETGAETAAA